jgi:hypothetical protein
MHLNNLNITKLIPKLSNKKPTDTNYSILIVSFVESNNVKLLILFGNPDLESLMLPPIGKDTMSTLKNTTFNR